MNFFLIALTLYMLFLLISQATIKDDQAWDEQRKIGENLSEEQIGPQSPSLPSADKGYIVSFLQKMKFSS